MIEEEFLKVKKHVRIKYTGSDPTILLKLKTYESKSSRAKGFVVNYIYKGYSNNSRITIRLWGGTYISGIIPEDWEVADDKRVDLQRARESRRFTEALTRICDTLLNVSDPHNFKRTKTKINQTLSTVPISDKFKIIKALNADQKFWLSALDVDGDKLQAAWQESVEKIMKEE